jgi:hypothetical protein
MSSYLDIARACDAWLRKNVPQYTPGGGWNKSKYERKPEIAPASTKKGSIRVPRDPSEPKKVYNQGYTYRKRDRKKYATDEERRAVMSESSKRNWASMTPEQKAERIRKIQASRPKKHTVPRHLRPEWIEYRRKWQRENKKVLTDPAEIQARRDKAKARYHAKDPAARSAEHKIRRDRYRAKRKAEKEKGLPIS